LQAAAAQQRVWADGGPKEANMVFAINYDLKKPGRDYNGLYEAIKACGATWHYLGSTWLVDTNLSAEGIWAKLKPHCDESDRMLIINVGDKYAGWLTNDAWEWIRSRVKALA
jgi:hypothetical protein